MSDAPAHLILYVEDNPANLALVERILERRGDLRTRTATRGEAGLRIAAEEQPDLVLLDRQLPDVDGLAVLRRLREEAATAHIPVVVVSADAAPANVTALLEAGAADYVVKPFDVNGLLAVVDATLALGKDGPVAGGGHSPRNGRPTAGPSDEAVGDASVDLVALRTQFGVESLGDDPTVRGLVARFLDRVDAQLAELRTALSRGDASAAGALTHDLKGSASIFGARRLARRCDELARCMDADRTESLAIVGHAEADAGAVRDVLERELADGA